MGKNRITNIGNATAAHDAVTLEQMNDALRNAGSAPGLVNRVDQLDKRLNRVNKEARSGIAGSTAMANIPQVTQSGRNLIGVGVGNYKTQNAVAVGYSRMSDNSKVIFKVSGAATTNGDYNVGAGLGYQW